jgi:hypothetical protein
MVEYKDINVLKHYAKIKLMLNNTTVDEIAIIGFIGRAGSGKSYYASLIKSQYPDFVILPLAFKLKQLLKESFQLELVKEDKDKLQEIIDITKKYSRAFIRFTLYKVLTELFDKDRSINFLKSKDFDIFESLLKNIKTFDDIRKVYQFFGTDICRKIDHNIWLKCYGEYIENNNLKRVICDDIRFKDELDYIRSLGKSFIFYIERPDLTKKYNHASEDVEQLKPIADQVIINILNTSTTTQHRRGGKLSNIYIEKNCLKRTKLVDTLNIKSLKIT